MAAVRAEQPGNSSSSRPGESKFQVVEQNGGLSFKAAICSQPGGAVSCTEELPVGSHITVSYALVRGDELGDYEKQEDEEEEEAEWASDTASTLLETKDARNDDRLWLAEQRSMTTFKVFSPFVKLKEGGFVLKTRNLLRVLQSLGVHGRDMAGALAELNGARLGADGDAGLGKAKNE